MPSYLFSARKGRPSSAPSCFKASGTPSVIDANIGFKGTPAGCEASHSVTHQTALSVHGAFMIVCRLHGILRLSGRQRLDQAHAPSDELGTELYCSTWLHKGEGVVPGVKAMCSWRCSAPCCIIVGTRMSKLGHTWNASIAEVAAASRRTCTNHALLTFPCMHHCCNHVIYCMTFIDLV